MKPMETRSTGERLEDEVPILCGSISRYAVGLGRAMHEAGYQALDLPYRYQPFEIDDVGAALTGMRALGIRGFGVSMPFKLEVLQHLDSIDPLAERIGAVNTVVNDDGRLVGHNTDAWGARRAFEELRPPEGARVLLLGAGGAARAVAFALVEAGARVVIANRTRERAVVLAKAAGAEAAGDLSLLATLGNQDVLVNASSAGMRDVDPRSPVPAAALRPGLLVMDIVYKPIETELVHAARSAGCRVSHGGRMLLHQASRQFELYTGRSAPLEAMDQALARCLGEMTGRRASELPAHPPSSKS